MSQATSMGRSPAFWVILLGAPLVFAVSFFLPKRPLYKFGQVWADEKVEKAPELPADAAWLNTAKPVSIHKDLKGKIVILDFWTFCCINCIHTLPDLAKLEEKYANQLVVIGVHSAKFDNEKKAENVRKAVLRYQVRHPVVNDPEMKIWDAFGCSSWPTLAIIDPEGNWLTNLSGEGNFDTLDRAMKILIDRHRKNKTLDETPIRFALEKEFERPHQSSRRRYRPAGDENCHRRHRRGRQCGRPIQ
jgi:thiol-disulfide isomerase/thioredoxin